jgi:hypothetical protein
MKFPPAFLALGYAILAPLCSLLFLGLAGLLNPSADSDFTSLIVSQVLGYGLAIFTIIQLHAPEESLSRALGFVPPSALNVVASFALGALLYPLCNFADEQLAKRLPQEASSVTLDDSLDVSTPMHRWRLGFCFLLVLPIVIEAFYRGALTLVLGTNANLPRLLLYLAAMSSLRSVPSFLVLGLLAGLARDRFHSTWAAVLLHMGFFATPIVPMLVHHRSEVSLPLAVVLAMAGAALVPLAWLLSRSAEKREAAPIVLELSS